MIKSSHKRQLGERPELKSSTQSRSESSSIRLTVCGTKRGEVKGHNTSHRADCMQTLSLSLSMLCAVSHHHPRGRNDGAQKYYIVAALVPFLFVVHVEKFPIAAQLESVIEKLMLRLVARTISLWGQ